MTRVLVTGATGFIGQATLPLLVERGFEVHGVCTGRSPVPMIGGVNWHRADLLDQHQASALVRDVCPERLLHLAWCAQPGEWLTSLQNLRWVEESLHLIREFVAHGGESAVICGSCAEYDLFQGFCSEATTPLHPRSLYGTCKHAVQSVLAKSAADLGLQLAWARVFYVYGPAEHPLRLVSSVIRSLLNGQAATCAYGGHIRDYLHSYDVGSALVHLLGGDIEGPINVASGIPLPLRDLVLQIGKAMGRPDLVEGNGFTTSDDEPPLIVGDVRRLHEVAGWRPSFTLEAGLEHTISWWRENSAPAGDPSSTWYRPLARD